MPNGPTRGDCELGNWQPDFVAISQCRRRIALIDVTRPSDELPNSLQEAYQRKQKGYAPLLVALQSYSNSGWQIAILPWVVGIRGMVLEQGIVDAWKFLDLPDAGRRHALEGSVRASVEAFAFLHRIRFTTTGSGTTGGYERSQNDMTGSGPNVGGSRAKRCPSSDLAGTLLRWKNMAGGAKLRKHC